MGYTALYSSLTTGSLCGRWPDIGLWSVLLSLADRNGVVDVTPDYLARVTGLAVEEVTACMRRFCEPDPCSRTPDRGGARLVLVDERRAWGWLVVNHRKYADKARKAHFDAHRAASGENAARLAQRRALERRGEGRPDTIRRNPQGPDATRHDPPSDSDSDSDSDSETSKSQKVARRRPTGGQRALNPDERCEALGIAEHERPECDPETIVAKFETWLRDHPSKNWCAALATFARREWFSEEQHEAQKQRLNGSQRQPAPTGPKPAQGVLAAVTSNLSRKGEG